MVARHNAANALRRCPLDNPPADGAARPPSIPLRASVPPAGHRCRPAVGRNVLRAWPRGLVPRPRRLASRTALRTTRLIHGPASPAPLRLHSRTPLHSGRPTVTDCSTVRLTTSPSPNQFQRVETPPSGFACRRRLAEPNGSGPHAPVGSDARGGTTPLGTRCAVRSQSSLPTKHHRAPQCECPPFAPAPAAPEPRAGDGGRHCDGASRPRRVQPSTSHVRAFSVTSAAWVPRIKGHYGQWVLFRPVVQVFRHVGTNLRRAYGMWS